MDLTLGRDAIQSHVAVILIQAFYIFSSPASNLLVRGLDSLRRLPLETHYNVPLTSLLTLCRLCVPAGDRYEGIKYLFARGWAVCLGLSGLDFLTRFGSRISPVQQD